MALGYGKLTRLDIVVHANGGVEAKNEFSHKWVVVRPCFLRLTPKISYITHCNCSCCLPFVSTESIFCETWLEGKAAFLRSGHEYDNFGLDIIDSGFFPYSGRGWKPLYPSPLITSSFLDYIKKNILYFNINNN